MAPTVQRSEIEALVYNSKRGDADALLDIARTIATREKHTVMTILAVVRDHTNRNRGLGHYIAEYGNDHILNRLHTEEASPYELGLLRLLCNAKDSFNNTPLHEASRHGNLGVMEFLWDDKMGDANVGSWNQLHQTPLHLAVENNHRHIIFYLARRGADVNLPGLGGDRPLHLAARLGHYGACLQLLDAEADPLRWNGGGSLPSDCARHYGHRRLVKCLVEAEKRTLDELCEMERRALLGL